NQPLQLQYNPLPQGIPPQQLPYPQPYRPPPGTVNMKKEFVEHVAEYGYIPPTKKKKHEETAEKAAKADEYQKKAKEFYTRKEMRNVLREKFKKDKTDAAK